MGKQKTYDTALKQERAVLVGVITPGEKPEQTKEYLDELAFLVDTAGGKVEKNFTQKMLKPDRATFVGTGKLEEIQAYVKAEEIDMVVFDDELSPSQLRNIERELQVKILDRSNLILDIFAGRAQTAQARTQVELAQSQYLLPRLTRLWTHLERQKGGIGMRGPGESQIETDRRLILEKISLLKERLKLIDRQNETQRKNRSALIRVALVGYTNVGKSTIMVFNKIDAYVTPERDEFNLVNEEEVVPLTLADFKKSWMAQHNAPAIFISATEKENIEEFKELLYEKVKAIHVIRFPFDTLLY